MAEIHTDVPDVAPTPADDIGLREFVYELVRGRSLILASVALFAIVAGIASFVLPKRYEARVLLSVVNNETSASGLGELSPSTSGIGGIASLAGLGLSSAGGQKADTIATLQSDAIARRFIQDNQLLPILYSSKWDAGLKKWRPTEPKNVPTLWKATQYFNKDIRSVSENVRSGLVSLTINWTDPKLAAEWANDLVRLTNEYLRNRAISESERNILYLRGQAANATVVQLQLAIYALMESEIKKQMIARGSEEYSLKVIDPAEVPEKPASPKPVLWVLISGALGGIFAVFVILFRVIWRKS